MPNFKVGDEVVCIDAILPAGHYSFAGIKAGERYVVAMLTDKCVGIREAPINFFAAPCRWCHQRGEYWHIEQWRFIKLDGLSEPENESVGTSLPSTLAEKV